MYIALIRYAVFDSPAMAASGALICVLAGPTEHVERVKPFTTGVMGRAVLNFSGEPPAKASLLKIIGNTFVAQMVEALGEGYVLAEKTGLGIDKLHSFVEVMFPGPYTAYGNRLMSGDYYNRAEVSLPFSNHGFCQARGILISSLSASVCRGSGVEGQLSCLGSGEEVGNEIEGRRGRKGAFGGCQKGEGSQRGYRRYLWRCEIRKWARV